MGSSNVISRGLEVAELQNFIEEAASGRNSILCITGDSGLGKTTLAENIFKKNHINYYITQPSQKTSFPFEQTLKLLKQIDQNSDLVLLNRVENFLRGEEESSISREQILIYIKDLLIKKAGRKPIGLIFDELQWSDSADLELINDLSDELKSHPVIFICIYGNKGLSRGNYLRSFRNDLRKRKKLKEIVLRPFSLEETSQLISKILNTTPSDELVNSIWKKTAGNPFLTETYCRGIIEHNIVYKPGNNEIPLPENLRDIVLLGLSHISEQAYNMLELAAVIGYEVDLRIFSNEEQEFLTELFDDGILNEINPGRAVFKHDLLREAIASEISWSRKRELNKRAAEFFIQYNYHPDIIAKHWLNAKNYEKASEYFILAAQKACLVKAYKDAASSAKKALDYWTPSSGESRRIDFLRQFAYCAQLSGMLDESLEALTETLDYFIKENNLAMTAEISRSLALVYSLQSKWDLALQYRIKSAQTFEACSLYADAANEYLNAALRSSAQAIYNNALLYADKAIQLAEAEGNNEIKARGMGLKGNILAWTGNYEEGRDVVTAGLNLALENNLHDAASDIYRRLASTMEYGSNYFGAVKAYDNAYNFCITTGREISAQICLGCMSSVLFMTGEWNRSLELSEDLIKNKKTPTGTRIVGYVMSALINCLKGKIRSAKKYIRKSEELLSMYESTIISLFLSWCYALILEMEKDYTAAGEVYKKILKQWKQTQDRHDAVPVFIWAISTFSINNSEKDLTETAEALTTIINDTNNPEALSGLLYNMGELAYHNRQYDLAHDHLSRAMEQQRKLNIPLEKLLIGKGLAKVLIAKNKNTEACALLEEIYTISTDLDTRHISSEIFELLKELNSSAVNRSKSEAGLLTSREVEILKHLSEGLTNKEIAAKLFISTRTVDMHVAHIYDKLNCRTRGEAIKKAAELFNLPSPF